MNLNRNFPFQYPAFEEGAGPHAVSERTTRALADFAFDHPNVVAVFTFSPEDNLFQPWKANKQAEGNRIKTTLMSDDAPYTDELAKRYRQTHGGADAPASPDGKGSFSEWAYFHYGRWSLAARGWWIPKTPEEKPANNQEGDNSKDAAAEKKPDAKTDDRAAAERNMLRWFAKQEVPGFSPWKVINHPDFPNQQVEVGGFRPFYQLNPPANELDPLAEKHAKYLTELTGLLPKLTFTKTELKPLGGGLYQLKLTVRNEGFLPTMSRMGEINKVPYPLQLELKLPEGALLLEGDQRTRLPRLAGSGGQTTREYLIRTTAAPADPITATVSAPAVGQTTISVEWK